MPHPTKAIEPVEMQEFLFATTSAKFVDELEIDRTTALDLARIRDHIRGALRCHRFTVINWLMVHGVKIPVELLDDRQHPEVGQQMPDR